MVAKFSFYSNHNGVVRSFEREFDNILSLFDAIQNFHKTCLGQGVDCSRIDIDKLKEGNDLIDFSSYQEKLAKQEELERKKAEEREKSIKEYEEKRRELINLLEKTENTLRYVNSFAEKFPDDNEVKTDQAKLQSNIQKLKDELNNLKRPE